jgi:tetratricopeptide (TPR) repeat protein
VDLREVIIKKKRKRSSDEANMGNVIVALVFVLIGIVVFYWLIIIPYYVALNTLPASRGKTIKELEEIAARFEPLASYGRAAILNQALEDWDQIVDLSLEDQQEVLKTLEEIGLKSLNIQTHNYFINQKLFLFYYNLSNTNDTFLISADKYAKKLIDLSPEHINSHESMIRFYLAKKDYQESKKWIEKWKSVHPGISFLDRNRWDSHLEELKNQIE